MTTAEAIRLNVCETYLALGGLAPEAMVEKRPDRWQCLSPFCHPIANFAAHFDISDMGVAQIAAIAKGVPHFRAYVTPGDSPRNLGELLEARGLSAKYRLTGMEATVYATSAPTVLCRALDGDSIRETARFMVDTFFWRSPESLRKPLVQLLKKSAANGHEFYFAGSDSIEAAATLSITGGIAGLYNLCVRPDCRSKGIGSDMVRQLSNICLQRAHRLVLQCDGALAPWYGGLGFSEGAQLVAYAS